MKELFINVIAGKEKYLGQSLMQERGTNPLTVQILKYVSKVKIVLNANNAPS